MTSSLLCSVRSMNEGSARYQVRFAVAAGGAELPEVPPRPAAGPIVCVLPKQGVENVGNGRWTTGEVRILSARTQYESPRVPTPFEATCLLLRCGSLCHHHYRHHRPVEAPRLSQRDRTSLPGLRHSAHKAGIGGNRRNWVHIRHYQKPLRVWEQLQLCICS